MIDVATEARRSDCIDRGDDELHHRGSHLCARPVVVNEVHEREKRSAVIGARARRRRQSRRRQDCLRWRCMLFATRGARGARGDASTEEVRIRRAQLRARLSSQLGGEVSRRATLAASVWPTRRAVLGKALQPAHQLINVAQTAEGGQAKHVDGPVVSLEDDVHRPVAVRVGQRRRAFRRRWSARSGW
eukprot:1956917-Prymnesium_polylepis.3